MESVTAAIKLFLVPGSEMFLLLGVGIAASMLFAGGALHVWGRRWLLTLVVLYLVLALPMTSDALFAGLSRHYHPLRSQQDADDAQLIIVLGNGVLTRRANGKNLDVLNLPSAFGALEAARLYHRLAGLPILASGGPYLRHVDGTESEVMRATLVELGVPAEKIDVESQSRNTREQVLYSSAWLRDKGITKFVLVTSPEHMLRAASLFEKLGFHPTASISQLRYGGTFPMFFPTRYALQGSEAAIYEYVAYTYYWARGWV